MLKMLVVMLFGDERYQKNRREETLETLGTWEGTTARGIKTEDMKVRRGKEGRSEATPRENDHLEGEEERREKFNFVYLRIPFAMGKEFETVLVPTPKRLQRTAKNGSSFLTNFIADIL
jgi:hypothetical protein